MSLVGLPGKFAGGEMFVLGNGPALDAVDLAEVPPEHAIGVNRTLLSGYVPDYLLVVDWDVWERHGKEIVDAARCRPSMHLLLSSQLFERAKWSIPVGVSTSVFRYDEQKYVGGLTGPLAYGYLTGYYAAEIAARMVAPGGKVYLCGMDLEYPEADGVIRTHFFGNGREVGCSDGRFAEGAEMLRRLRDNLKTKVEFVVVGDSVLKSPDFSFFSLDKYP